MRPGSPWPVFPFSVTFCCLAMPFCGYSDGRGCGKNVQKNQKIASRNVRPINFLALFGRTIWILLNPVLMTSPGEFASRGFLWCRRASTLRLRTNRSVPVWDGDHRQCRLHSLCILYEIRFCPFFSRLRPEDAYQVRRKDTTLSDSFLNRKPFWKRSRYVDLSELFPVQFGQQVNQVQIISHVHHSHPELIVGDRVECLLEVHKALIQWLQVLACLVHQYSEIHDLVFCPPSLLESSLFVCNFCFGLHFQYDPKKDLACMWDKRYG